MNTESKDVRDTERLTTTFLPRKRYVVHCMTLKKYLLLGLELKKIHRVLCFTQTYFLKNYIDFCTAKRVASKNDFGKTLWKFIVNSCFGKFIERVRDRLDCKFAKKESSARRHISDTNFKSMQIINRNLVTVFSAPKRICLNKPIAVGFTILDRSKEFMFDKYYNEIRPQLNCEVIYGDTDSLFLLAKNKNKNRTVIDKIHSLIDFSNYPSDHPEYDVKNKNRLGFFKDELQGEKISEFVSLRSKSYSFIGKNENQTTKLKGVTKGYRKEIPFQAFLDCLTKYKTFHIDQFHIRSRNHTITTDKVNKLALSSFDVNRYIMPCGIHTVPYGSFLIKKCEKKNKCPLC